MKSALRGALALLLCLVATLTLTGGTASAATENPAPPGTTCTRQVVPVTLSPGSTTTYNMVGWLCVKPTDLHHTTVQVLLSGLTYDHFYWNVPYQPNQYSYVYYAATAGWSTFNIDRLGVGQSDKPPANLLTIESEAYALEQVIQKLRAGTIGGSAFTHVVAVGHSLGAGIAQYAAATATAASARPDYLVLADFLNSTNVPGISQFASTLIAAQQDPTFASAGLPDGYLTTTAGTRGSSFYNTATADPNIIALDEQLKQTGTTYERSTLADARTLAVTQAVQVPTLITVGQDDAFYCNPGAGLPCTDSATVLARESPNYSARACLSTWVVIDGGHSTNYAYKAPDFYNTMNTWLTNYLYNYAGSLTSNGCLP